jgi:hypothetical protein
MSRNTKKTITEHKINILGNFLLEFNAKHYPNGFKDVKAKIDKTLDKKYNDLNDIHKRLDPIQRDHEKNPIWKNFHAKAEDYEKVRNSYAIKTSPITAEIQSKKRAITRITKVKDTLLAANKKGK